MCDVMTCDDGGSVGDATVAELLSAAFDAMDADGNGEIEYEEYVALMSGAKPDSAAGVAT